MHYTQEDGSSLLSGVQQTKEITGYRRGAFLYYYLGSIYLFNITVNFEKYEILENSQTKSRKGFEGVRTLF